MPRRVKKTKLEKNIQHYRKLSRWVLLALSLVLAFLGYRASKLEFDYDFEKFFPKGNDDLSFYKAYRETFENDNDFILIAVRNDGGIFKQDFLKEVEAFTDSLKKLPHLREVISPIDVKIVERNPMGLGFSEKLMFSLNDQKALKEDSIRLVKSNQLMNEMIHLESKSLIILLKNVELISKEKSDELATALEKLIDEQSFDEVVSMGKIIGQKVYIKVLQKEFLTFMAISIGILILFLIIAYRSVWGVIIPLATVLLAVIGSLGLMQLSGASLNMMTTLLPVIMLVVGMSDVVHLISKYLEEIRLGNDKISSLRIMVKKVGVATLLTSLTTALGFATLIAISIEPIQLFGKYTAIGVLLAFVLSILFIPSIFIWLKKPKVAVSKNINSGWHYFLSKLFILICRRRIAVSSLYVLLTLLSIWGASKIKFDYFLMQDLNEEHSLMKDLRFFQKNYGGIRPFEMAILPQKGYQITDFEVLVEIDKLTQYLDSSYQVNQMLDPTVPYKYANQMLRDNREEYFRLPNSKKRFEYIKKQMEPFEGKAEWNEIIADDQKMGRIFGRLIDPGSYAMLQRNEDLDKFYRQNINANVIDYKLTGSTVIIDKSGRYVSKSVFYGLLIAFALIATSMGLLFRSIKMALLSLVPNIFPILFTAGFIGFAQIDLNMSTAIVFTIAFGIAVDDTIHFLSRYRQELRNGRSRLFAVRRTYLSTGKAIIITTIILFGGFASLMFSAFLTTFYIGLFVSMTLILAVITDLTLLPLLLLGKQKAYLKTTV